MRRVKNQYTRRTARLTEFSAPLHAVLFLVRSVFLAAHIRVKFFGERSDALAVLRCCLCFRAAARIFLLKLVSRYRLCFYTAVYFSAAARFRSDTSF